MWIILGIVVSIVVLLGGVVFWFSRPDKYAILSLEDQIVEIDKLIYINKMNLARLHPCTPFCPVLDDGNVLSLEDKATLSSGYIRHLRYLEDTRYRVTREIKSLEFEGPMPSKEGGT